LRKRQSVIDRFHKVLRQVARAVVLMAAVLYFPIDLILL
jgi:hypothetical protein